MSVEYDMIFPAGQAMSFAWTMDSTPATPHVAVNITGWTFKLSVRERNETPVLFTLTLSDGLSVVSAVAGTLTILFASAKTRALVPGVYVWDMWRMDVGNEQQLDYGILTLRPRVTELP